jgi:general secretion pathway protein B
MSLILDALNRADQERSVDNKSPNLQTSHSPAPQPSKPIRRWLIEALIILMALGAFVFSKWPEKQLDSTPSSTSLPSHPVNSDETLKQYDASQNTAVKKTKAAESNPPLKKISAVINSDNANARANPSAEKSMQSIPVSASTANSTAIASLYQKKNDTTNTTTSTKPIKSNDVNNTQTILQQIPLLTQHSPRFQNSVPSIVYGLHVYSDNDRAGFVKLNGSIRKIGAEIEPGLRVIAILKDSVVLDYKGRQFRLAALNSWVNFK